MKTAHQESFKKFSEVALFLFHRSSIAICIRMYFTKIQYCKLNFKCDTFDWVTRLAVITCRGTRLNSLRLRPYSPSFWYTSCAHEVWPTGRNDSAIRPEGKKLKSFDLNVLELLWFVTIQRYDRLRRYTSILF